MKKAKKEISCSYCDKKEVCSINRNIANIFGEYKNRVFVSTDCITYTESDRKYVDKQRADYDKIFHLIADNCESYKQQK